jgi:hypothetical protein
MADIFNILVIALFVATAIYYIVLFSLIYYWHLKKASFVIVPALFAFDFLLIGFLIISIVYIVIKYLPDFIKFLNT